jgi:hypothetical protein
MQTPRSMDLTSVQPMLGRAWRALTALNVPSGLAITGILIGWFFIDTLIVSLGSLQHGVRFFDMSAVIADPARLFLGVDSSLQRWLFGVICLGCLAAPVASHLVKDRLASLAYLAPLALVALSGTLLYSRTSAEFFATPASANNASGGFIRFADDFVRHGGGLVARHISIGAGGYLALSGSVVLAVLGIRRFYLAAR